jgi:molecular chaperone DnaK (HSP70)
MEQESVINSACGVDLGSKFIKLAGAKKGGVVLIEDETSKRFTPFLVGFGPSERLIG